MRLRTRSGQHTAEFAMLIGLTALAAVGMQTIVRKALSRGVQTASDVVLGVMPHVITAQPDAIDPNTLPGSTTLHWSMPGRIVQNCFVSGDWKAGDPDPTKNDPNPPRGWSGPVAGRGKTVVTNITRATTFRLTCDVTGNTLNSGPVTAKTTVTIGSLNVQSTQKMDMQGQMTTGFQTTQVDAISGTAENQDIQTRTLPKQ